MHKFIPLSAALMLAVAVSPAALAQGQGQGKGQGQGQAQGQGQGQGQNQNRGNAPDRGQAERGPPADRGQGNRPADRPDNRTERALERAAERVDRAGDRAERAVDRLGEPIILRRRADRGLIDGCPPGLAKRNNGCLPPGQERRIARARYENLFQSRFGDARARYEDGYLYRLDPRGAVLGYVPMLGGALARGAEWPARYAYEPAPAYYADYFGLDRDRYDYRYADGALYGVDPQTRQIAQIAALLTGQDWTVGQPAPIGYDVYNVPYQYRDQYRDSAEARYRYSDGQIFQIDPTTRLVMAVIQLLT